MRRLRKSLAIRAGAENIASVSPEGTPALRIVEMWQQSPGHRRNMLGDYSDAGAGIARRQDGQICVTLILLDSSAK